MADATSDPRPPSLDACMAQKANLEAIFHSVADGIVTLDTTLTIRDLNRAALEIIGTTKEEASGRPVRDLLHGRQLDIGGLTGEALETGRSARERETILLRPDGEERRIILSASRLLDPDGRTAGAVLILRDVTHLRRLEAQLEERAALHSLIGRSHAMQEIFSLIEQVAPTDSTVLILGESGTGKELIADAIHESSDRREGPHIRVNCSAFSEGVLESELFGHVKGAFTGAVHDRKGRFESAHKGTIFLDEIGDLSERIQIKLLRVLEQRSIERVGDTRPVAIDVRIVTATHRDLRRLVDEGTFRSDLFYRLNVIPIHVPPLRARREDIPLLAEAFLRALAPRLNKPTGSVSTDAMRALMDHDWPGNVRELRNAIEHAAVKAHGTVIRMEDLPREILERIHAYPSGVASSAVDEEGDERRAVLDALHQTGWNRGSAASRLGINRTTLWRKMKRLGIAGTRSQ